LEANLTATSLLGVNRSWFIKQPMTRFIQPEDQTLYVHHSEQLFTTEEAQVCELRMLKQDRTVFWVQLVMNVTQQAGSALECRVVINDFTERKLLEQRLRASLHEKDVLLKEIHHRVKNNMQVISSLVNLQASTINDPDVQVHLQDIRDRIRSMALVHEKLYETENLSNVPFEEYVGSLLNYLKTAHRNTGDTINFTTDLQPVSLWIESAVPCGLILNELVTNALKHAFKDRPRGEIATVLHRNQDGTVCLRVSDDGVGMPPELDWRKSKSLGLRLIDMLAKQLNAVVELNCSSGTEFKITFKPSEVAEIGEQSYE